MAKNKLNKNWLHDHINDPYVKLAQKEGYRARAAYKLLDEGFKVLLLNLAGTKIVNSIGISILIEIIEKMIEIDGKLGFCCLTPTIDKTFHIMGLAQYAAIYPTQEQALQAVAAAG